MTQILSLSSRDHLDYPSPFSIVTHCESRLDILGIRERSHFPQCAKVLESANAQVSPPLGWPRAHFERTFLLYGHSTGVYDINKRKFVPII